MIKYLKLKEIARSRMVELGISTFGQNNSATGQLYSHERIRQLVAEIERLISWFWMCTGLGASSGGLCGIGARIVLAAGAVNTKKIRLTSAVSILSV